MHARTIFQMKTDALSTFHQKSSTSRNNSSLTMVVSAKYGYILGNMVKLEI